MNTEITESDFDKGYNDALRDVKRELEELTVKGYQYPLLHIFGWIDKKLLDK